MFMKIWVQHDQGGVIGLAFKFFDLIFHVVRVLWVVVELGVVRTYARTSNVTNYPDEHNQTKQTNNILK